MKKTILILLLIAVIIFGALSRLSVGGWLFLAGLISIGVFGLIHLIAHLRYIKISGQFRLIDYGVIIVSHILYLGLFLFQSDFGDDGSAVVVEVVLGSIPINNLKQNCDTYLSVFFITYIIWTTIILFRIKYLDKSFSVRKIMVFGIVIVLIIALPIGVGYTLSNMSKRKERRSEEKNGRYEDLDRALKNIKNVKYLRLYDINSYTEIPAGVFNLTELEELEMYSNKISSIPSDINRLKKLRILDLQYNMIQEIPREVFELKNLEEIVLLNNDLKSLSPEVCSCTSLKSIQVSGHSLDSIPFCINDMPNLEELVIQSDSINSLMDDLRYFNKLKKLSVYSYGGPEFDSRKYDELKEELKDTKHNW